MKYFYYSVVFFMTFSVIGGQSPSKACNMLIAVDQRLFEAYNRDLKNTTKMVQYMVTQLNKIYQK